MDSRTDHPFEYDLFAGDGAFREALRRKDWSQTAIGNPDGWPHALRNTFSLMLDSQFPMFVAWGPERTFLYNAAYVYLLEGKHPASLGEPTPKVWPELWSQVKPLMDAAFAGKATYGEDVMRVIRRNGHAGPATFTLAYSPVRDDAGAISGAFCVISETTARTLLEQRQAFQLKLSDALRTLTDPGQIMTMTAELLGNHLGASRILSGDYDGEQQLVTYHSNYTSAGALPLDGTYPAASFGLDNFRSLDSGATWVCDDLSNDPRTSDAQTRPTFEALAIRSGIVVPHHRNAALISCLFVNDSRPRHWTRDDIRLVEDVADRMWNAVERARAEVALLQADRRKDQFLATLAHELRNPLAPISSAAELLKVATLDSERVRNTGALIARQVSHMTGLVDDLLDVSRVTSGVAVIQSEEVDIKRVISDAMEQVRPLMEARKHRCVVQTAPGSVCVSGDFSQAERSADRAHGGLGLGLALVKSLVDLHGGSVSASSAGRGAGSTFTVRLPRLPQRDSEQAAAWPERNASGPGAALRLLVVDDNVDGAQMLAMFLEASGHLVAVEHSAQAALARAEAEKYDAFLLDIGLPGMDGRELAHRLRALPQAADAMLVAITGYGLAGDGVESLKAGFDHYMVKPVDPAAVATLLAGISFV